MCHGRPGVPASQESRAVPGPVFLALIPTSPFADIRLGKQGPRMVSWLIIGSILYAWVLLTVLGGERHRRLRELQVKVEAELALQQQTKESPAK